MFFSDIIIEIFFIKKCQTGLVYMDILLNYVFCTVLIFKRKICQITYKDSNFTRKTRKNLQFYVGFTCDIFLPPQLPEIDSFLNGILFTVKYS